MANPNAISNFEKADNIYCNILKLTVLHTVILNTLGDGKQYIKTIHRVF
jgi:hypothetical protein